MINRTAFEWLKSLNLNDVPVIPSKAMWCGFRSHPDLSNRFPWIVKKLFEDFNSQTYVEIGIAQAGGLVMGHSFASKDGLIVGIDPLKENPEAKTVSHSIFAKKNVHLIRKKSQVAVEDLRKILGDRMVDILIIDGDHTHKGSLKDFVSYIPLMNIGGLIWFDDIAHEPGVNKAWKEIKSGLSLGSIEYDYWDWGVGEVEGGKKDSQGRLGIDGAWITRKN